MAKPPVSQFSQELGASSEKHRWGIKQDEFLPELRGHRAIRKYREMSDNDPIIGACLKAMELMIRAADWRVDPAEGGDAEAEFVETVFEDMEGTWDEFVDNAMSMLVYGFSFFEIVTKRRLGPEQSDPARRSRFTDGRIGIRKLAPRPQWSLQRFEYDDTDNPVAFIQQPFGSVTERSIPMWKGLLFRTTTMNDDPTGRSVLRNAYKPWYAASHVQMIELIAVERELNGVPVGRIPAEYLSSTASATQRATRTMLETILRDLKLNEQGYALLPSDTYIDNDGKPTNIRMMDIELMSASGTRAIDTGSVITRHQQDIARTMLADFIMLGSSERGSFALSKSKTDLFLSAIQAYADGVAAVINRDLIPLLWRLNGFRPDTMPHLVAGKVAPADLTELGEFLSKVATAGAPMFPDVELENHLRMAAGLPERAEDPDLFGRVAPDDLYSVPSDVADVASREGLNGAQIRAVLDVLQSRALEAIDRTAAVELLVAVGMNRHSAATVVDGSSEKPVEITEKP